MKVLSEITFEELLTRCSRFEKYKGLIVFKDMAELHSFANALYQTHTTKPIPGICEIRFNAAGTRDIVRIDFSNCSTIEFKTLASSYGSKCHELLFSQLILSTTNVALRFDGYEVGYLISELNDCVEYRPYTATSGYLSYISGELVSEPYINRESFVISSAPHNSFTSASVSQSLPEFDKTPDSTELDEFLKGFNIVPNKNEYKTQI